MIIGIGVEVVDVVRFQAAEERFGARLRERLFTRQEREYASLRRGTSQSLAVRFAAKLAARKALGLRSIAWQEVEVVRLRGHPPTLRLRGQAARQADQMGVTGLTLSLTHDASFGIGEVVLEGRESS